MKDKLRRYTGSKHYQLIEFVFTSHGFSIKQTEIMNAYMEPHRFYHNWFHIETLLDKAKENKILTQELLLAIIFHDIVYDPKAIDNEEKSAELFTRYFSRHMAHDEIVEAILETKNHNPKTELGKQLCELDLEILNSDFETFIEFEHNIAKEYQFVDYSIYREKRIEILTQLGVKEEYINYVRTRKPRIAIYAGSFNPFHKGHLNILKKAEKMFDKVIIARGVNPDKLEMILADFPKEIQYREIIAFTGLMSELLDEYEDDLGPVTLIRGLRNGSDLSYEMNQYRFIQDFKPDVQVCSIFCDKEYEHVSSSAIRALNKFGKKHSSEL